MAITIAITVSVLWFNNLTIQNILLLGFLIITASIIIVISSDKKIYLESDGILVKKKFRQYKILWNNIMSMATVSRKGYGIHYEIRTTKRTLQIPLPMEWKQFESTLAEKAGLELTNESIFGESLSKPGLKRWSKKGQRYMHTSISDRFMDVFYKMRTGK
jgi:hypothetical protein